MINVWISELVAYGLKSWAGATVLAVLYWLNLLLMKKPAKLFCRQALR